MARRKNQAAVAMGRRRWAGVARADRIAWARAAVLERWRRYRERQGGALVQVGDKTP